MVILLKQYFLLGHMKTSEYYLYIYFHKTCSNRTSYGGNLG